MADKMAMTRLLPLMATISLALNLHAKDMVFSPSHNMHLFTKNKQLILKNVEAETAIPIKKCSQIAIDRFHWRTKKIAQKTVPIIMGEKNSVVIQIEDQRLTVGKKSPLVKYVMNLPTEFMTLKKQARLLCLKK